MGRGRLEFMNPTYIWIGTLCVVVGLGMLHPGLAMIAVGGLCFLWASPEGETEEVEEEESK